MYETYWQVDDIKGDLKLAREHIGTQFQQWFETAATLSRKFGTEPSIPRVVGRQEDRSNVEARTPKEYYKKALVIPLLDHLAPQMDIYSISALKTTKYCIRCSALFQSCWSLQNTISLKMHFSFMLMTFHRPRSPTLNFFDGAENGYSMINLHGLTTRLKLQLNATMISIPTLTSCYKPSAPCQ